MNKRTYEPKEKFLERLKILLEDKEDVKNFLEYSKKPSKKSIRVNTLKISSEELIKKLKNKNWKIKQPYKNYREILQVEDVEPGELGNSIEHLLGYYYVQEITSMMPIIALSPNPDEIFLDLCAAPGSKTTQAVSLMKNKGIIIANDVNLGRISILSSNLERFGATNTIVTRHSGNELCDKLKKLNFKFDKILVDAPCSGEGNIRCSPRTYLEWSEGLLKNLSKKQKRIVESVIGLLKEDGELIYSTCTHSPEENECVVQYLLDNYSLEIEEIKLPLKTRPGLLKWNEQNFHKDMKKAVRIYHHDNDLEGFFLCKMRLKTMF